MKTTDNLIETRKIVQLILKAKKIVRLYPQNNPIYMKMMNEITEKFTNYFQYEDRLQLLFGKNDIFYDSESVYHSNEINDNLALLFFKDGIKEVTFSKGTTPKELEEFLRIISLDFEKESLEDDIVTCLWEKDFTNITYVVEDIVYEDEDCETSAMQQLSQRQYSHDYKKIYDDFIKKDEKFEDASIFATSEEDLSLIAEALEKDSSDKTMNLINMLFELLIDSAQEELKGITDYFTKTIEFFAYQGNIKAITEVLSHLKKIIDSGTATPEMQRVATDVVLFSGSQRVLSIIADLLDNGQEIDKHDFERFISFLNPSSIPPLINILGELKSIHGRKKFINALVSIGAQDIAPFLEKLNDPRWYMARNIIHILRAIGNKKAAPHVMKTVGHEDIRVRKEAIKALGDLGDDSVLPTLQNCLQEPDLSIRIISLQAMGNVGSDQAKKIIMNQISGRDFREKAFNEKKVFFEVLAKWNDNDVREFLIMILKKRSLLSRSKMLDTKACAAYCLGLVGKNDALPVLENHMSASHRLLRDMSAAAAKRIKHGNQH